LINGFVVYGDVFDLRHDPAKIRFVVIVKAYLHIQGTTLRPWLVLLPPPPPFCFWQINNIHGIGLVAASFLVVVFFMKTPVFYAEQAWQISFSRSGSMVKLCELVAARERR
jgi:hypothetical protein